MSKPILSIFFLGDQVSKRPALPLIFPLFAQGLNKTWKDRSAPMSVMKIVTSPWRHDEKNLFLNLHLLTEENAFVLKRAGSRFTKFQKFYFFLV